jgi:hypothetical protein
MLLSMDYPSRRRDRANLNSIGSSLRSSRRGDPRSEYSGPSANTPKGPATGAGANRVRSPGPLARRKARRQRGLS